MKRRPISEAEIERGKSRTGGFTAERLRAWGLSFPPKPGWRRKLLRFGVPAACPFPEGFEPPASTDIALAANPLMAFGEAEAVRLPDDALEIFADGSCYPNPGPGGWGFAAFAGGVEYHCAHGGSPSTTNNRMELTAAVAALEWLDPARPAILWSDSHYVVRGVAEWRHGWRRASWTGKGGAAPAHADLWETLFQLFGTRTVDLRWTRGHAGTAGNERADALAAAGRRTLRSLSRG